MKKTLALMLALLMLVGLCAGCGNGSNGNKNNEVNNGGTTNNNNSNSNGAGETNTNVDPYSGIAYSENTEYRYLYASEITTMNYLTTSVSQNQKALANFVDTLVEYDSFGNVIPCLAESWDFQPETWTDADGQQHEGQKWTFRLRKDAKWYTCDGEEYAPVTAGDFVYSARLVADSKFDSDMPDMLIQYVRNGVELYNEVISDFTQLGVEAEDDYTLVYHLKQPCAYFVTLLTYGCYLPINGAFYESLAVANPTPVINDDGTEGDPVTNEFGTDRDKILYNGGYICSSWLPQEEFVWVKNENYWDAGNIFITKVSGKYNAQADAIAPEMYLRGELEACNVTTAILDDWLAGDNAKYVHSTMPSGFVQYMQMNFAPHFNNTADSDNYLIAVNNKNFRLSIVHGLDKLYSVSAYDPDNAADLVWDRLMPDGFCVTDGKDYNEFGAGDSMTLAFDEDLAREYRDKAKTELAAAGCTFPVQIPLYYNPARSNQDQCCQLIEAQLESTLGNDYIEITVYSGPATNYIGEVRRPGLWGLFEAGWGPDYADPATFFEPFGYGWTYGSLEEIQGDEYKTGHIYTEEDYAKGVITDEDLIGKPQMVFNSLVEAALAETQDMAKRYELFSKAEEYAIQEALIVPYMLLNDGYVADNRTVFDREQSMAGICGYKYKFRHMLEKSYSMEEYEAAKTAWEAAKAK